MSWLGENLPFLSVLIIVNNSNKNHTPLKSTENEREEIMGEPEVEENQMREAALASTPLFQPNFKSSKVTQAQLDKFKDLHKRRLLVKQLSEDKEKFKGNARRCDKKNKDDLVSKASEGTCASNTKENTSFYTAERKGSPDEATHAFASKKRRKLHWGLDAKERWERKANM